MRYVFERPAKERARDIRETFVTETDREKYAERRFSFLKSVIVTPAKDRARYERLRPAKDRVSDVREKTGRRPGEIPRESDNRYSVFE